MGIQDAAGVSSSIVGTVTARYRSMSAEWLWPDESVSIAVESGEDNGTYLRLTRSRCDQAPPPRPSHR